MSLNDAIKSIKDAYNKVGISVGDVAGPPTPGKTWPEYEQSVRDTISKNQLAAESEAGQQAMPFSQRVPNSSTSRKVPEAKQVRKTARLEDLDDKNEEPVVEKAGQDGLQPGIFDRIGNVLFGTEESQDDGRAKVKVSDGFMDSYKEMYGTDFSPEGKNDDNEIDAGERATLQDVNDAVFGYDAADSVVNYWQKERSGYTLNPYTGEIMNNKYSKPREFESRDSMTAKREANGEVMWHPEYEGLLQDVGNGRVKLNPQAAEEDSIGPPVFPVALTGISNVVNGLSGDLRDVRNNYAVANADWVYDIGGKAYDAKDVLDAIDSGYDENLANSQARPGKPPADGAAEMFSKGFWYTYADPGNSESEVVELAPIDASEVNDDGTITPHGEVDWDRNMFVMSNGSEVPLVNMPDGSVMPQLAYQFTETTGNPDEAIGYNTVADLTMGNGETLPFEEAYAIVSGQNEARNANDNPFMKLKDDNDFSIETALTNPGELDAGDVVSGMTDAVMSSVPYLIPNKYVRAFTLTMPSYDAARYGVDPFTYDPTDGTYADPGSLSMDEYYGNIISTAGETVLEGALGIGRVGGGKVLRKLLSPAKQAEKAEKDMLAGVGKRTAKTAVEEAVEEGLTGLTSQAKRGDWWNNAFANQAVDPDTGELVWDEEGKPVYDKDTPMSDRAWNGMVEIGDNAIMGGLVGGGLGLPGAISSKSRDRKIIEANGGIVPGSLLGRGEARRLTEEEQDDLNSMYDRYMEQRDKESRR